jgi:hypothetical protein
MPKETIQDLNRSERAGDKFCSIAVFSSHCNFGFNRGSEITDPGKIFLGEGQLY